MNILIIEPYYTGSHKQWAEGYKKFSRHNIKILSMEGRFWKWRMHGGAITMAKAFNNLNWKPNCILATDMIDLSTFISLTKDKCSKVPIYIYFHENQLSYPWSPNDTKVLVTSGVFRFTRNPMYLGLVLLLSAYYLLQPTPFSPFGLLGVLWFLTRFQIVPEERVLTEKFGDLYVQYKQNTRRWF